MEANERTRDIYEVIPGYPKPPLVPLPEPDDVSHLEQLGVRPGRISYGLLKAAMFATGFKAFQKQLPKTIEGLLRRHNLRGPGLYAPVISATLALEDDPRHPGPLVRAATLLFAVRSLYEDIISGRLPPDELRGQVLEMGQYPNLFSTSITFDRTGARLYKSTNTSRVIVTVGGRFYALEVENLGIETTIEQLTEALAALVHKARRNPRGVNEPAPGVLTCAGTRTQYKGFPRLQKIEVNAQSLAKTRNSFVTLCLDLDSHPESHAEAALLAHSGNCGNRWYHSSLQLVVFGNARACAICSFDAYVDGNTMMRGASEIQRRAALHPLGAKEKGPFVRIPAAAQLHWKIDKHLIQQAHQDLEAVRDDQQATFEISDIGSDFFIARDVQPVPVFILALQMTAHRLTGKMAQITQFLTMSKYRCMGLEIAVVTTPEVVRFVEYLEDGDVQHNRAMALMQEAINSQVREARKARRHLSPFTIFTLFLHSRKGLQRVYVSFVVTLTFALLRVLGLFKPRRGFEIVASHPTIYPEIPVVGRPGARLPNVKYFGLHYQIFENRTVVTMMPSVNWTVPYAEFIAVLEKDLKRIQSIVRKANDGGQDEAA